MSLFFLFFLGMGLLFVGLIVRQVYLDGKSYGWSKTECVILESGVHDKGGKSPYEFQVHYQYQWQGSTYDSHRFKTQNQSFSDYGDAQRLAEKFRGDTKAACYVDPRDPTKAILEHTSLWIALFIFLPLIFMAIGGGGLYITWKRPGAPAAPAPISLKSKAFNTRKPAIAFFFFFLVIGLAIFHFIFIRPVFKILHARHWPAVPCTVVSSRVQSHDSDDGTTYSVDILYAYKIDDREYRANRYSFMGGSSSGYSRKAAIVRQHPPGTKIICYVNPTDPTDAVLHRNFSPTMWFGLLPLLFVMAGLAGVVGALRKNREAVSTTTNRRTTGSSPLVLKPRYSPSVKFVGGVFVSIFWNGIVSVFIWLVVQMWMGREHGPKWFLTLFLIPFVAIGLVMIGYTIHSFFGLFSPRAQLRVDSDAVALGDSVELHWQFSGRADKIRDLRLLLEGREEADEGSGDDRRTRTKVFYKADIIHLADSGTIKSGSALCSIPSEEASSSSGINHRIIWVIRLRAKVDWGADLNDEYPITVIESAKIEERLAS